MRLSIARGGAHATVVYGELNKQPPQKRGRTSGPTSGARAAIVVPYDDGPVAAAPLRPAPQSPCLAGWEDRSPIAAPPSRH